MALATKTAGPHRARSASFSWTSGAALVTLQAAFTTGCSLADPALLPDDSGADAGIDHATTPPDAPGATDGAAEASEGGAMRDAGSDAPSDVASDDCVRNMCGGCATLSAALGDPCGTCGTYACDTQTLALKCDDPGTTNMCPTWCTSHPAPAGVAATDYQCVDFDNGLPPAATWTQTVTNQGAFARSNARASSPSYSASSSVTAASEDAATITWSNVGNTQITSLSVAADIAPVTAPQIVPPSTGGMDVLCLASGGNKTCLEYTVNGNSPTNAPNFTGFYVFWSFVGGAAVAGKCALTTTNLTLNLWTTVVLTVTRSNGAVSVTFNGTEVASGCAAQTGPDTVASFTVGATTHSFNNITWQGYFDNIVATVRR